jgi:hypothetical protein
MTDYLDIPFESDPDALSQIAFDYITNVIPGWVPSEANLDVIVIRAMAHVAAEVQDIASAVPTTIFRYMGATLFNIPPIEAVAAQGLTDWTMVDNAGYTVPAGTQIAVQVDGSTSVAFQTLNDFTVPALSTTATAIPVEAVLPGADGSGLNGAIDMISSIGFVSSIVLEAPTTGGLDAEQDDAYLNRLRLQLTLLAPRPIIPVDFAVMATDIAGVQRALALDGYDPVLGTFNNEREITLACIDVDGNAVSSSVQSQVAALLENAREVNFIVNIIDPIYTSVDVTFQVKAEPNYDATDLAARVTSAITDFVSPANWGLPQGGDNILWEFEDTVRYLSLAEVINNVLGVRYIEAMTIGLSGGAQIAGDQTLTGPAPLPLPGTIGGTVDL